MRNMNRHGGQIRARCFILASAFAAILLLPSAYNLTGTGAAWTVTLTVANLTGGAGTNFTDTIESGTAQYVLDIGGGPGSRTWQIDVSRTDTLWNDAQLTLSVQRTSDGAGTGWISGGDAYHEITIGGDTFFTGQETRTGINLQYQISGLTVTLGVNSFSTTVTYTIATI